MASFPTSVKSFTTKNTGDAIVVAHPNDLQDEVTAIEAGYLNGTARINSSASTLATLSVTGASTLAKLNVTGGSTLATLNVTGGSTVATLNVTGGSTVSKLSVTGGSTLATLNVTGGSTVATLNVTSGSTVAKLNVTGVSTFGVYPVFPPPEFVRVHLDAPKTIGSSVLSTVNWLVRGVITNSSMHSDLLPSRLVPQTTGIFQAVCSIDMARDAGGYTQLTIKDSSGSTLGKVAFSSGNINIRFQAIGYKYFDVLGGYVTAQLRQQNGAGASLSSGASLNWFSLVKL